MKPGAGRDAGNRPVVFITGAAKRIGRVIALDFASRGWDVGVHCNKSRDDAILLVREIEAAGAKAVIIQGDLASPDDVRTMISRCAADPGVPSCLINNASLFENDTIDTLTPESWDAHLDINLKAPVLLSQEFARLLPDGQSGNIINIIDQKVRKLTPYFYSYTISKSGLWTATRTMAQALAPRIRVNAIGPGPVLKSIHQTEEQFDRQWKSTPLKRGTTPEEIASAVQFILNSPAMTGQMIMLDGGQHLKWRAPASQTAED